MSRTAPRRAQLRHARRPFQPRRYAAGRHTLRRCHRVVRVGPARGDQPGLGDCAAGLRAAIASFASAQIRNRATLGGNLANASPAADSVPPLVAAGAVLTLRSGTGTRRVPADEFALGPGRTCLTPGEWIHTIDATHHPQRQEGFRKIAGRRALAISVVSLAWSWTRTPTGLQDVRLAAGAVAPTVMRCRQTEEVLTGHTLTSELASTAAATLRGEISPIDDLRATADYRRAALAGALIEALAGAAGIRLRRARENRCHRPTRPAHH